MDVFAALTDLDVLILTIVGEARGEPIEGQVAVGCSARNRLHGSPAKYKGYRDVCMESKQYSCWNPGNANRGLLLELAQKMVMGQRIDDPYIRQCFIIGSGVSDWGIVDNTKGSTNYMTFDLFRSPDRPKWARAPKSDPIQHGNQVFFSV